MKTYLVSYDLDKPKQNYSGVIGWLEEQGAVRVLYSEWVVRSDWSAADIRDALMELSDSDDRLLVVALTGETAWKNLMITDQAFKKALTA